jgi:hypothetical protein
MEFQAGILTRYISSAVETVKIEVVDDVATQGGSVSMKAHTMARCMEKHPTNPRAFGMDIKALRHRQPASPTKAGWMHA